MKMIGEYYLDKNDWQWCEEVHYLKNDESILRHICDLNGIVYTKKKEDRNIMYLFAYKGHDSLIFDLFAEEHYVPNFYHRKVTLE